MDVSNILIDFIVEVSSKFNKKKIQESLSILMFPTNDIYDI